METITIRNQADLVVAIRHLMAYTPRDQWVVVPLGKSGIYPTAGLFEEHLHDPECLKDLRIYGGAQVLVVRFGADDTVGTLRLVSILEDHGATIVSTIEEPNPQPTADRPLRQQWVEAEGQQELDEAYDELKRRLA